MIRKIILVFFVCFTCLSGQIQKIKPLSKSRDATDARILTRQQTAQSTKWQPVGPSGGMVESLCQNPQNRNELYALNPYNSKGRIFKSVDSGRTWMAISLINYSCYDLEIDPQNPNIMYLLYRNGVLKSADGGLNWTSHSFPSHSYGFSGRLAVHPQNSNIVFACGYCYYDYGARRRCMALFKSTDGGVSWTVKQIDPKYPYAYSLCMAIDPLYPDTLYVGGYCFDGSYASPRVYKSTDGGNNWGDVSGNFGGYVNSIIIDPTNTAKVFAGTSWGIYRSSDGGQSWQQNMGTAFAYALTFDCENPNTIYAGYFGSCYKSVDGGITWIEFSAGLYGICNFMLSLPSPPEIFYGSYTGIFRSDDGGSTWNGSHAGIMALDIPALAVAPSSPNILYAEANEYGFYKSSDFGQSWTRLPDFYRCDAITKILVNPNTADDLFILAGG